MDSGIESDVKYKPDIVFYDAEKKLHKGCITSFQQMELFVEFKRESVSDPFIDTGDLQCMMPFQKLFDTTCATCGQMVLYSTRMQMYQFRTCVFSVGIFGSIARLFRWDRAGAIVSEPIKYSAKGNRELSEFFYRFNLMDRTQRGWDPTVCDATKEETVAFTQAIHTIVREENLALFKSLLESVGDPDDYPRRKINVGYDTGKQASYIVGRSSVAATSPTGRATRGFVAMDTKTKKLVFLKDSWRLDIDGVESEDHWYERLKGGRNLAAFLHGSDVGYPKKEGKVHLQYTIAQNFSEKYCNIQGMMGYIHYRIVQSEFYIQLNMFKDSKNLTQIMYDVILGRCLLLIVERSTAHPSSAIQYLYDQGILHRDISVPNIMVATDGRGRLIDFDLAREVGYSGARRTVRTVSSGARKVARAVHRLISDFHRARGSLCRPDCSLCKGKFTSSTTI